jgi:hypothetical protein
VVLTALNQAGNNALHYASRELCGDVSFVKQALVLDGSQLRFVSQRLRNDKAVVLVALKSDWKALAHASPELKKDPALVLAALAPITQPPLTSQQEKEGSSSSNSNDDNDEADDDETIMRGGRGEEEGGGVEGRGGGGSGFALRFCDPCLLTHREFMLAEVERHWQALHFACKTLRADPEVVLAGVAQNGHALQWANERWAE